MAIMLDHSWQSLYTTILCDSYMTGRNSLHVYAGCGADPTDDTQNKTYNPLSSLSLHLISQNVHGFSIPYGIIYVCKLHTLSEIQSKLSIIDWHV